jgi:hypothetical protein
MVTKKTVTNHEIDEEKLERESALFWSMKHVRLPKNAKWEFQNRAWQLRIFDDKAREIVVRKPTQIGMTTITLCKMLHFATYRDVRVMYTLPRQDDVSDLVNGRFTYMITESPFLASRIGSIDSVRLKTYCNSYLHFMESSVPPRMLDVDLLINDEVDLSDQNNLEQYIARLDASKYGYKYRLSTPTITGFGISSLYEQSDQKVWMVQCDGCNHYQELDWDRNVIQKKRETILACEKCGKQISPEWINDGEWVAKFPAREISGYAISQLMVPSIPLERLMRDFKTMRPQNFYNLRMGVPYDGETNSFSRQMLYENCFLSEHERETRGSGYFIGADQGNDIHVVVGKRDGNQLLIVYAEVIPMEQGFEKLRELFYRFNARKMIIDAMPNRHSALSLVQSLPRGRARVAFYIKTDKTYVELRDDPQVNINRSIIFDALYEKIKNKEIQFYGKRSALDNVVRTIILHLSNMKRTEQVRRTPLMGERIEAIWTHSGADHFAHALCYMLVASESVTGASLFAVDLQNGFRVTQVLKEEHEGIVNNNPYYYKQRLLEIWNKTRKSVVR